MRSDADGWGMNGQIVVKWMKEMKKEKGVKGKGGGVCKLGCSWFAGPRWDGELWMGSVIQRGPVGRLSREAAGSSAARLASLSRSLPLFLFLSLSLSLWRRSMLYLVAPISTTGALGPRQSRKSASATAQPHRYSDWAEKSWWCLSELRVAFCVKCAINFLTVFYQIGNHGNAAIQASEQQGSVIFYLFIFFLPWHWTSLGSGGRSSRR